MTVYSIIAGLDPKAAIFRLLQDFPDGRNTSQIADALELSLPCVSNHLSELLAQKKISLLDLGRAKVYYV